MNIRNENLTQLYSKVTALNEKKDSVSKNSFKGVFIFVSFDLVNSTKIKYRDSNWLRLINELIAISNNEWFGLNFWKFNGDEVLFYAEVVALNQVAKVLHQVFNKANFFKEKLLKIMSNDKDLGFASDLLGIKTAIWMAYVSNEKDALNSKLDNIDYMDFAGINMDEGFRMSKCAIQNKIIVDPKIAFLICLVANELYGRKIRELGDVLSEHMKSLKAPANIEEVFGKFWLNQPPLESECEDLFKVVANNFRVIGYETCKGVWDERPYPIIWYSDNWEKSIDSAKYDEIYNKRAVTTEMINMHYKDCEHSFLATFKILEKIYKDVSIFRVVINKMLLECNFRLWTTSKMDKLIDSRTYLYYSIVCIFKETNGVLVFQRSKDRGHLPNVWDFEQQKNAQTLSSASTIMQIQDRFKNNFGINIRVVQDKLKKSIIPIDIHPIYRKGKIHNGILCYAYIEDDKNYTEQDILNIVKSKLNEVVSGYGYPLYSDARFIHAKELMLREDLHEAYFCLDGQIVTELTYEQILKDSNSWNNHEKGEVNECKCTTNFVLTVYDAINYKEVERDLGNNDK